MLRSLTLLCAIGLVASSNSAWGQQGGLADLDDAIVKKIDAKSEAELRQVEELIDAAIAKGLDEENLAFAKKMLGGISLERGQAVVNRMMQGGQGQNRMQQMRSDALNAFEKAVENDPSLADAHLLIARLSMLPGGNPKRAFDATTAAIDNLVNDPTKRSGAYVLRALLQEDEDKRRADLDAAIDADDSNSEARQARALFRLQTKDIEGAVADLKVLLDKDPTNTAAAVAAAEALLQLDRSEDAFGIIDAAITAQPSPPLYMLRAELNRMKDKTDEALADLDRALAMDSKNATALLLRAEIKMRKDDVAGAKADIDTAMSMQPGNARGVLLRSLIAAEQKRYADAINDMKLLARNQPDNNTWALQLGNYYQLDKRPNKAIEVADEILKREPGQWQALRLRGDAYLSINKHREAIADYETALQTPVASEESQATDPGAMSGAARSGLLNNLAWVLATSPQDNLRSGERAVQYGTEAAELTEFKEAHILSTLAAGYAESGDFAKAIEWASKAVELGKTEGHEQIEQLENELKSYRENKPWREEQSVEENDVPILAPEEIIDT
jgi:predicted Zn-dependent protease